MICSPTIFYLFFELDRILRIIGPNHPSLRLVISQAEFSRKFFDDFSVGWTDLYATLDKVFSKSNSRNCPLI